MSIQSMTVFFAILCHSLFGYEFTHRFPDEENVQLDLFFSCKDVKSSQIERIVLSDIYYTIAYQEVFEGKSSIDMTPHVSQILHTSRLEQPYQFRLAKVTKMEYPSIRTFWQKLLDLSKIGPTKEEFEAAKEKLKRIIDKAQQHAKNFQNFIKQYRKILNEITDDKIHDDLSHYWVFKDLQVDYKANPLSLSLTRSPPSRTFFVSHSEAFNPEIADVDKEHIYEIIHTMGTNGLFSLLRKKNHLQTLGKKIHHVEPLQLLCFVVTNPTLKQDMREVQRNTFKWINFIDGLSKPILRQWREGDLQSQLPGFSKAVGKNQADLQKWLDKGKVEDFVMELIR